MINIYVDGSYNSKTKESGWAYIILFNNRPPIKSSGKVFDISNARNVTGELEAVLKALESFSQFDNIYEVNIYYDYLGIEKWANYKWKANILLTQAYQQKINILRDLGFKINFIKVKSHSGDKYNDMVDLLAKKGCGLK